MFVVTKKFETIGAGTDVDRAVRNFFSEPKPIVRLPLIVTTEDDYVAVLSSNGKSNNGRTISRFGIPFLTPTARQLNGYSVSDWIANMLNDLADPSDIYPVGRYRYNQHRKSGQYELVLPYVVDLVPDSDSPELEALGELLKVGVGTTIDWQEPSDARINLGQQATRTGRSDDGEASAVMKAYIAFQNDIDNRSTPTQA